MEKLYKLMKDEFDWYCTPEQLDMLSNACNSDLQDRIKELEAELRQADGTIEHLEATEKELEAEVERLKIADGKWNEWFEKWRTANNNAAKLEIKLQQAEAELAEKNKQFAEQIEAVHKEWEAKLQEAKDIIRQFSHSACGKQEPFKTMIEDFLK